MKQKYCISIDWLQVCCFSNLIQEGEYMSDKYKFVITMEQRETPLFKRVFTVRLKNIPVAIITQEPRSKAIKQGITLIKLENRVLYHQGYIRMLYALIEATKMKYKGITRLDLCYDCNKFYDGHNPAKFVRDFVFKAPDTKGGVYRKGSDNFTCHGARNQSSSSKITSISFGSENSRIRCYMYDKTIELKEVKDKPWIRKMWKENGLVSDDKTHVWRSEISIKAEGMDILNMSTGQLWRLSPNYLEHYENIEKIFHYYAAKVFDFRINTGQQTKRHFKKLFLFNTDIDLTNKPVYMSESHDTGRMEKICYNKLEKLSQTYVDLAEVNRNGLYAAMQFLSALSGVKLATVRNEAYKQYLDNFKAYRFMGSLDFAYLDALERCADSKREIDANYAYRLYCSHVYELENNSAPVL